MRRVLLVALILHLGLAVSHAEEQAAAPTYEAVAAIFDRYCVACHSASVAESEVALDSYAGMLHGSMRGPTIVPGHSEQSELVKVLTAEDGLVMPPEGNEGPSPDEISLIRAWIDAGALGPQGMEPDPKVLRTPRIETLVERPAGITALAWSPDGARLAVARGNSVELVAANTHLLLARLDGHRGQVNDVAYSKDGKLIASAAGEPSLFGEVRLWDAVSGQPLATLDGHRDSLYAVAFSPDAKLLATGSYDQEIKLWDVATHAEVRTLTGHNGPVFKLEFTPDGQWLASASGDRTAKLWNAASGERLDTFGQPLEELYALAFSPDGRKLVAGGEDNRLRLWAISETGAEGTSPLEQAKFAHEEAILRIAYSPDGQSLASSGDDRAVKVWNADLTPRFLLASQPDVAPALAFSPDGKRLAVGRLDGSLAFHDAQSGEAVAAQAPPAPELSALEPRGVQRGSTTPLRLTGKALLPGATVRTSDERIQARVIPPAQVGDATTLEVEVTIDEAVSRGAYDVWVETPGGASAKQPLQVDDIPQAAETAGVEAQQLALPVAVWGRIDSRADVDIFEFDGRAGQTIVADVSAATFGSKLDANLIIRTTDGTVLAKQHRFATDRDPLLAVTLPADGRYQIQLSDLVRGGSAEHFYRLSLGELPYVIGAFPLGVLAESDVSVQLVGYNLGEAPSVQLLSGSEAEVAVPVDQTRWRVKRPIRLAVDRLPQTLETEPNNEPASANPFAVPGTANGRIEATAAEEDFDLFRFESKASETWILEVDAARRGSPLDSRIEVLHADGQAVARVNLHAVRDSYIEFRGIDSNSRDVRLKNWEEMGLNQLLYLDGEVSKLYRMPQGPDSGFQLFEAAGKRRTYFDTSAFAHALGATAYIVEPRSLDAPAPSSGLPVFTLNYSNDDDAQRQLGRDSRLTFVAPADGAYFARVSDTLGRGGPDYAYRLTARRPTPDFSVALAGAGPTVNAGSGKEFTVTASRIDGFEGPIRLELTGAPPAGVTVTSPLTIEAGHHEARGVVALTRDATWPADATPLEFTATAEVAGKPVQHAMNALGVVQVAPAAKLSLQLLPDPTSVAIAEPGVITVVAGRTTSALLRIERQGFDGRVELNVNNLPHGLIVDNIGLNGVLIPEGQTERQIFLNAADWVAPGERLIHATTGAEGGQSSPPALLRVVAPQ